MAVTDLPSPETNQAAQDLIEEARRRQRRRRSKWGAAFVVVLCVGLVVAVTLTQGTSGRREHGAGSNHPTISVNVPGGRATPAVRPATYATRWPPTGPE